MDIWKKKTCMTRGVRGKIDINLEWANITFCLGANYSMCMLIQVSADRAAASAYRLDIKTYHKKVMGLCVLLPSLLYRPKPTSQNTSQFCPKEVWTQMHIIFTFGLMKTMLLCWKMSLSYIFIGIQLKWHFCLYIY